MAEIHSDWAAGLANRAGELHGDGGLSFSSRGGAKNSGRSMEAHLMSWDGMTMSV